MSPATFKIVAKSPAALKSKFVVNLWFRIQARFETVQRRDVTQKADVLHPGHDGWADGTLRYQYGALGLQKKVQRGKEDIDVGRPTLDSERRDWSPRWSLHVGPERPIK